MSFRRLSPLCALLLLGGCAYDYAESYAPQYPPGYDTGMGSGQFAQPGDQFGGQNVASIDVFLAPLAGYGRWVDSRYGRAFQPDAPRDWRPYVNGRWGENRLWISNDPWGWATDHYGRWGHDDRLGWVWVPGTEWAPSWVAWREDEARDVTGWAPVPPGVAYSVGVGFGSVIGSPWGYDNYNSWYGPSWIWVPRGNLYQPGFGGGVLPWQGGSNYWRGSRWNHNGGYGGGYGGYNRTHGNNNAWNNNGRPNNGRPNNGRPYSPRPGIGEAVGGSIAGLPTIGRPGTYQGRPPGQYQGRPSGQYSGRPSGQYQGTPGTARPPRNSGGSASLGETIGSSMARPPAQQAYNRPQQGYNPPQQARPAPPPRAERPAPPQRQSPATPERSDERPQ